MHPKQLRNLLSKEELEARLAQEGLDRTTLSFYRYAHIKEPGQFRNQIYTRWSQLGVLGRIYVAQEGINGQVSVPTEKLDDFRMALEDIPFLRDLRLNIAIEAEAKSFLKLKIKVRKKIVADGLDDDSFDVTRRGRHLGAEEVNELMEKDGTIVVDMRNYYESEVGHFEGALTPDMTTFREGLPMVEDMLEDQKDQDIIMYCTGGIRCEKASAYYLHKGFQKVHMIDGGIIEYTRQCEQQGLENKFKGKNFVFDERLGERISTEVISTCHQCGQPTDRQIDCENIQCHLLFIQCESCAAEMENCCTVQCRDFKNASPKEQAEQLPKLKFHGKQRKAWKAELGLLVG
ncbi:MAG: rhodanese-related sulfurtransferase [Bacteroidota bacterium]